MKNKRWERIEKQLAANFDEFKKDDELYAHGRLDRRATMVARDYLFTILRVGTQVFKNEPEFLQATYHPLQDIFSREDDSTLDAILGRFAQYLKDWSPSTTSGDDVNSTHETSTLVEKQMSDLRCNLENSQNNNS